MEPNILEEAEKAVYGDRQEAYGSVTKNFGRIAGLWTAQLGEKLREPITPTEVGLMMVLLKVSREAHKHQRDNLVDGAGYFATIEKMQREMEAVGQAPIGHIAQVTRSHSKTYPSELETKSIPIVEVLEELQELVEAAKKEIHAPAAPTFLAKRIKEITEKLPPIQ